MLVQKENPKTEYSFFKLYQNKEKRERKGERERERERERDLLTQMPPRDDASPSSLGSSTETCADGFEFLVRVRLSQIRSQCTYFCNFHKGTVKLRIIFRAEVFVSRTKQKRLGHATAGSSPVEEEQSEGYLVANPLPSAQERPGEKAEEGEREN